MKSAYWVLLGCIGSLLMGALNQNSYTRGVETGKQEVIYSCNTYGRYHFDGTQELLCSAIVQPSELMPKPYVPYTKEQLDSTKTKRR